jgi:SNF2 family DNA or RNA helicase
VYITDRRRQVAITARRHGSQILITFPFDRDDLARVKSLPKRTFKKELGNGWLVPLSDLELVRMVFGEDLVEDPSLKVPLRVSIHPYDPKTSPREYQILGSQLMAPRSYFGNFDEQGLGKTKQTLDAFGALFARGVVKRMLVVCKKTNFGTWLEEVAIHSNFSAKILDQNISKWDFDAATIFVINYDKLTYDKYVDALKVVGFDVITCDECHLLKNQSSERFKGIAKLDARFKWALTGTPYANGYEDVRAIGNWLGDVFGSYTNFANRYLVRRETYGGWKEKVGYMNLDELQSRLNAFSIRRLKADVASELPEKVYQNVYVPMTEDQERVYEQMRTEMVAEFSVGTTVIDADGTVIEVPRTERVAATVTIAKMTRLQQIAVNPALIGGPDTSGKLDAAIEMVEELVASGEKVVVWSHYVRAIESLIEKLSAKKIRVASVYGATVDREGTVAYFTKGDAMVLVANPSVAGAGLNLQVAAYEIFLDSSYSYIDYCQAVDRCHRIGQSKTVTIYNYCSTYSNGAKTIDAHVFGALVKKAKMAAEALGDRAPTIDFSDADELIQILEDRSTL